MLTSHSRVQILISYFCQLCVNTQPVTSLSLPYCVYKWKITWDLIHCWRLNNILCIQPLVCFKHSRNGHFHQLLFLDTSFFLYIHSFVFQYKPVNPDLKPLGHMCFGLRMLWKLQNNAVHIPYTPAPPHISRVCGRHFIISLLLWWNLWMFMLSGMWDK